MLIGVCDSGSVLVPVFEERVVLAQHEVDPREETTVNIADVAGVLERGPSRLVWAPGPDGAGLEETVPGLRVFPHQAGDLVRPARAGVKTALGASPGQDPGPVLGVRDDHGDDINGRRPGPVPNKRSGAAPSGSTLPRAARFQLLEAA